MIILVVIDYLSNFTISTKKPLFKIKKREAKKVIIYSSFGHKKSSFRLHLLPKESISY